MNATTCADYMTVIRNVKYDIHVLKMWLFQVTAVMEGHPAGKRKRRWVSVDTFAIENKIKNCTLTCNLLRFVCIQVGDIPSSVRETSLWVKRGSGSKRGAAQSAADPLPVPEPGDPAAPGSLHTAQLCQGDERGEFILHDLICFYRQFSRKVMTHSPEKSEFE